MNADQIRKELSGLAQVRAGLEGELGQVRKDVAKLLQAAEKSPDISMTEAAKLAGISRVAAYEALKR